MFKLTCFCVNFSFSLYDSLFLSFPLLYNHFKQFLEFRPPPFILLPLLFLILEAFPTPLIIGTPSRLFAIERTDAYSWH